MLWELLAQETLASRISGYIYNTVPRQVSKTICVTISIFRIGILNSDTLKSSKADRDSNKSLGVPRHKCRFRSYSYGRAYPNFRLAHFTPDRSVSTETELSPLVS